MAEDSIPKQDYAGQPFSLPFRVVYQHHVIISLYNRRKDIIEANMIEEELINRVVKPFNEGLKFGIGKEVLLPDEIKQIKITKSRGILCDESYGDLWNSVNSAEDVTAKFITKTTGELSVKKRDEPASNKQDSRQTMNVPTDLFDSIVTHSQIREVSIKHFKNGQFRNAVLDAAIRLEEMVKEKANYPKDNNGKDLFGARLMHFVFDGNKPVLSWCNERQKDELEGYKLIFAGTMQGIRDPKAHSIFEIDPTRALKLLSLLTLLAELVDASTYNEPKTANSAPIITKPTPTVIKQVEMSKPNTERIIEDLLYLKKEILQDLESQSFQKRAFRTDVFYALKDGLIKELNIGTFRKIQQSYESIDQLRFPISDKDMNKRQYEDAIFSIQECLKSLE